jgi:hypothetical protein
MQKAQLEENKHQKYMAIMLELLDHKFLKTINAKGFNRKNRQHSRTDG